MLFKHETSKQQTPANLFKVDCKLLTYIITYNINGEADNQHVAIFYQYRHLASAGSKQTVFVYTRQAMSLRSI